MRLSTPMHDQHPDAQKLAGVLDAPGAQEYASVRAHLASCEECRTHLLRLQSADDWLRHELPRQAVDIPSSRLSDDVGIAARLASYDQAADPDSRDQFLEDLKRDPQALKSALHFVSRRREFSQFVTDTPQQPNTKTPNIWTVWTRLFEWRPAAWISVPVTAALVLALSLVWLQSPQTTRSNPSIVAYADDNRLYFVDAESAVPGIGFFHSAITNSSEYPLPNVTQPSPDSVLFYWQAVDNAASYTISLIGFSQGDDVLISKVKTTNTSYLIQLDEPLQAGRYEWRIEGETSQADLFMVRGGFVKATNQ